MDEFGASLGAIGDVNGDGFVDFAVGARSADHRGDPTGAVYVYFGGRHSADDRALETSRARLRAPDSALLGAQFGFSNAAAGDLNHDGYVDMAIGAPGAETASVWIYRGGSDGPAPASLPRLSSTGPSGRDRFGHALAGGADLNGDGNADLVVGAPSGGTSGGGIVYVYLGDDSGGFVSPCSCLQGYRTRPPWRPGPVSACATTPETDSWTSWSARLAPSKFPGAGFGPGSSTFMKARMLSPPERPPLSP